ncbi:MAG: hypothetical protein ACE5OZ_01165 [Candidatus Heimdallarchaeota archaeon]
MAVLSTPFVVVMQPCSLSAKKLQENSIHTERIHPHHRRLGPILDAIEKRCPYSSFICTGKQLSLVLRLPSSQHRGFTVVTRTEFGSPPQPTANSEESIHVMIGRAQIP